MVPSGWEKHPVGKICKSIVPGRNKPKSFNGNIAWVTTPEVKGRYIPSIIQKNYISKSAISECGAKVIPTGSVVIAAVGDLGLTAIASKPIVLNQQLHAFVCSKSLNNEYLAYFLSSQKPYMYSIASKTTIPYMNKTNCESIPILLPPFPEQQKIAQILSTWDKAISTTESLIVNSQQQKKSLMQQLLTGKNRFIEFEGGWELTPLGSVCTSFSGGTPSRSKSQYYEGTIPWIKSGEVNNRFIYSVSEHITEEGLNNSSAKLVKKDNLLVAMYGATAGKVAINMIDNAAINQAILALIPHDDCSNIFMFYLLEREMNKALNLVQGGQPNFNASIIKSIKINLPSPQEQKQIASVLTAADQEIDTLKQKLTYLKQEKKALMQQLLTGKRRVAV